MAKSTTDIAKDMVDRYIDILLEDRKAGAQVLERQLMKSPEGKAFVEKLKADRKVGKEDFPKEATEFYAQWRNAVEHLIASDIFAFETNRELGEVLTRIRKGRKKAGEGGLRKIRVHDLRHTFASLLIQDGVSLAYFRDQFGHYSIQITVDV